MKIYLSKHKILIILIIIIFLILMIFYTSPNFITKKWQQYNLNREFVCPENNPQELTDAYLYKYIKFYMGNYPNMTISNFLGIRMNLLISHNCITTLQNISNNNSDMLPDKNSVKELKNQPYDRINNPTLKELN